MLPLGFVVAIATIMQRPLAAAQLTAVTDYTNYDAGSEVRIRLQPNANVTVSIRYAGEESPRSAARSRMSTRWHRRSERFHHS
jgi:hypothetical protein